jgi:hypothetical protein
MRKEFSAISAFSAIIAFTAGIVLCMQFAQTKIQLGLELPGTVLWAIELGIFGVAVFAWRKRVSFTGWLIGIAVMAVTRIAIVSGAGYTLALVRDSVNVAPMLALTGTTLPRLCAAIFALMICYPMRVLLPLRPTEAQRKRYADGSAARAGADDELNGLFIVASKERGGADAPKAELRFHGTGSSTSSSLPYLEGEVVLPLSTVLALMPEHIVTDRALALCESEAVRIPFDIIVPQLREAQVVFSVADLREWIPLSVRKLLVQPVESDIETENGLVALPLRDIIPQIPSEVFLLPAPSLPAWARIETEERLVFAIT